MSIFINMSIIGNRAILKQKSLLVSLLIAFLCISSPASAAPKVPISIPLLDWSSQRVISKAIGLYLTQQNYLVQYQNLSEKNLWGSLARGHVHFQIETWQETAEHRLQSMIDQQRIVDLGKHSAQPVVEWWYPLFVEKHCPGLPDWRALLKCSHVFSESNSTRGVYHIGPWEYDDLGLIKSLGLNFSIKKYQDINLIWAKLTTAVANNRPILLLNWTPNWTEQRIPGKFIKFPDYHPLCETQASWGVNPELKFDCGNITNGWIKKTAWKGLKQQSPCVFNFIKNMDLSNQMISEASALIDYDQLDEESAAQHWLEKYSTQMRSWTPTGCFLDAAGNQ